MRWKQIGILLAGAVLAGAMVLLGIWQLEVYRAQGERVAANRAAQQPVALADVAPAGQRVGDAYGRTVTTTGTYRPDLQILVPLTGTATDPSTHRFRVVTGFQQSDGSLVVVVRGVFSADSAEPNARTAPPAPPSGQVVVARGIFLPPESNPDGVDAAGLAADQLPSVRVPALAQEWPGPLVDGFVTLAPDLAQLQKLEPAAIALPETGGRLRNGAYAFQWWVFAAFALALSIRMARDFGRQPLSPEPPSLPEPVEGSAP